MKSIITVQTPNTSIFPRSDVKPHLTPSKLLWLSKKSFSRDEAVGSGFLHKRHKRVHSLPTRIGSAALILAATTAPESADISVLLPTSAVMLFVYWIANFVLPELILKDIQADKTNEDGDENSPDGKEARK